MRREDSTMDGGGDGQVARLLDMHAARAAAAVLGLRREFAGVTQQWTLGDHGTFELDAAFVGVTLTAASPFGHQRISTTGRLWRPRDLVVVPVDVTLASTRRPPTEVSITPEGPLPPLFAADRDAYLALALAALDELAEELLFHARETAPELG
jgi:hypothetical protein